MYNYACNNSNYKTTKPTNCMQLKKRTGHRVIILMQHTINTVHLLIHCHLSLLINTVDTCTSTDTLSLVSTNQHCIPLLYNDILSIVDTIAQVSPLQR